MIERIASLVNEGRIKGISDIRDESDLKEPVRLVIDVKRDADPEVILNQLYQFSPLQDSFSLIFLALVDGKPRELNFKELLEEFVRHRVTVIRRRTQFLLAKARRRKHTVEGLLLALANHRRDHSDHSRFAYAGRGQDRFDGSGVSGGHDGACARANSVIGSSRKSAEQADSYSLTAVQADAILRMTLGQLVNLEQERLAEEHRSLLEEITAHLELLVRRAEYSGDHQGGLAGHPTEVRSGSPHRDQWRGDRQYRSGGLIKEETMVVSISHRGYIKRTPASVYRAQRRGGKGLKGATTEDEDPIEHLFIASTHAYLFFFTNQGKVYWQKVYELPELGRESRGRAIVNLLNLAPDEKIADCRLCAGLQFARALPDEGHPQRAGEENAVGSVQPTETGRHYRHQVA